MKPSFPTILGVRSDSRARIFATLLADPQRDWSVSGLAALLPDVSVEAVRATVNLMLDGKLLDAVPHRRSLTVRLTERGRTAVEQITADWDTPERLAEEPS